jgi:hypothetical protein
VAVVLTLAENKEIYINEEYKKQCKQYETQLTQLHIFPKYPHIHTPTDYKKI